MPKDLVMMIENSSNTTVLPLYMYSYVPENNLQNRPLLMLINGGAFGGGSKLLLVAPLQI